MSLLLGLSVKGKPHVAECLKWLDYNFKEIMEIGEEIRQLQKNKIASKYGVAVSPSEPDASNCGQTIGEEKKKPEAEPVPEPVAVKGKFSFSVTTTRNVFFSNYAAQESDIVHKC